MNVCTCGHAEEDHGHGTEDEPELSPCSQCDCQAFAFHHDAAEDDEPGIDPDFDEGEP